MCGIAGEIGKNLNKNSEKYEKMRSAIARRGPDQSGIYAQDNAVLVHTRLAVIDIENGRQPMIFKDGDAEFVLTYNGELYNTNELRAQLKAAGYSFETKSDTEVLLKSYVHWGDNCVKHLNGIYAFTVFEKHTNRLFLARDRIGVKPLFYAFTRNGLIFASEIKALLASGEIEAEIDINGISELMLIGPGRTPGCGVFKGVFEVPPAHAGYFENRRLRLQKYWKLTHVTHSDSFEQTAEKVRFLLTDSIERQLVSDVPVGAFLSGGLDSSIISAIAAGRLNVQLDTFTVDYEGNDKYFKKSKFQPNTDADFADKMNDFLGAKSHRIEINTADLSIALNAAVEARDLPGMADVDSSLLLFCKEIKKHCTVALSGECADEIFGGYPWYRDKEIREAYGFPWSQSTRYRAGFLRSDIAPLVNASEYVHSRYESTLSDTHAGGDTRMCEMTRLNFDWFMQTLLDRKDRMSMYSALEVRVPFCDYRIAEYLYSVPWEYKEYEGYEKGLLRYAMRDYLPDEILWRKKSPYPKTHNPAYLAAVSARLSDIINDITSPILGILDKKALENLLKADNAQPWYGQLMTTPQTIAYMVQINYWLEKYKVRVAL